ncbi:SLAM family member 9-like isoform X2 [Xiphophorus couchianus]|uniref:SLAM family member 9-like isoform X2 n=1 Tax=Xiphophorus couchianus TaxID=32473 RepID=UPI001016F443|nr:SLAM family member 9-like isoform X2 [Xiphophorus couchianus]
MSVFRTFFAVLLVYLMVQKSCAIVVYAKVGDSVVLHPGRSDVAKTTGSLIIHNLTVKDTGGYTPQINTLTLNPVVLKVIEPVPKPMVFLKCNVRRTLCDLTCKANTSSQFGPVTYKWEAGNKVVSTDNQLSLTEKDLSRAYTCKVKNPVSTSTSDEVAAPADKGFHPAAVAVPVVLVVLVLVVVGGYVKHRKEQKQAQNVEEAIDETSAMSLKAVRRNGISLESIESTGLVSPALRKTNSQEGSLHLHDDEEQWLHDDQELQKQSLELQILTNV